MQKARVSVAVAMIVMLLCPLPGKAQSSAERISTSTPVKHVVVIFDENNSFDHYFGAYPVAANSPGEPRFEALPGTPTINGLTSTLIASNPDAILNGAQAPFRLDRSQNVTCDNDNHYTDEQKAYNGGLLNQFAALLSAPTSATCTIPWLSMGYYDGNTVTALWNYAQHFAMSDNFFASNFGTTVMGHLNLIAGQTHGATTGATPPTNSISGKVINGSVIVNVDPIFDDCATGAPATLIQMNTPNIGTLLNSKGVSWGWFYGDWTPTSVTNGIATCSSEYDSHYAPFQYYAATANPHHLTPTSTKMIGQTDRANHQYAITDFWNAVDAGNMPAVTFLKPPHLQNGHPSDSSPLAEQTFLVDTINRLMLTPEWKDTAIFITYDDSDGWYDHVMPPIVNPSSDSANDALLGSTGLCGTPAPGAFQDRCGYGPRLPLLLLSPFAKQNFVSHTLADQSSILRFIEDNWNTGQIGNQSFDAIAGSLLNMFDFQGQGFQFLDRRLILNDTTGEVIF
jgi:phospholipase C